jgi:hypothetical protein
MESIENNRMFLFRFLIEPKHQVEHKPFVNSFELFVIHVGEGVKKILDNRCYVFEKQFGDWNELQKIAPAVWNENRRIKRCIQIPSSSKGRNIWSRNEG